MKRSIFWLAMIFALLLGSNAGAAIPIYTGSFSVATGGVITDPNAPQTAGAHCVGEATGQYQYDNGCVASLNVGTGLSNTGTATNPVIQLSGTAGINSITCNTNISCTTGANPTISEVASPAWSGVPTAGGAIAIGNTIATPTVAGNVNNSVAIVIPNTDGANYVTYIGTYSPNSVQGYFCKDFRVGQWNGTVNADDFCLDNNGNAGVRGNVTAANFFNGSRAEWKKNIRPIDGLSIVDAVHTAQYDCANPLCGPKDEHKVGIIANDSPTAIAGPHHDHYDAFALAAAEADAIKTLQWRLARDEELIAKLEQAQR